MNRNLAEYIHLFNLHQDYFECHERGEELWFERDRPDVLKGLIQGAVCLYHLRRGNIRGAQIMWSRAKAYLTRYLETEATSYDGVDILRLIRSIDAVHAKVPTTWYARHLSHHEIAKRRFPSVRVRLSHITRGTRATRGTLN